MIKVSILVPCYNSERYIEECLNSIKKQTLNDIEILCINDGSTDRTKEVINYFCETDKRFKLVDKKNTGYGDSLNVGILLAKGEYIGIVESDDFIDSSMYEMLYKTAKKNDSDFVKSDYFRFTNNSSELWHAVTNSKYYNKNLNLKSCKKLFDFEMMNWTGIYNLNFIKKNMIKHNISPGASYQDTGFWFLCCSFANKAFYLNKPFYHYRIDNPNSSINSKGKIFCICNEYLYIKNELNKRKMFDNLAKYFFYKQYNSYLFNLKRIDYIFREEFIDKYAKELKEAQRSKKLNFECFAPYEKFVIKKIISNKFFDIKKSELNFYKFISLPFLLKKEGLFKTLKKIINRIL